MNRHRYFVGPNTAVSPNDTVERSDDYGLDSGFCTDTTLVWPRRPHALEGRRARGVLLARPFEDHSLCTREAILARRVGFDV